MWGVEGVRGRRVRDGRFLSVRRGAAETDPVAGSCDIVPERQCRAGRAMGEEPGRRGVGCTLDGGRHDR
jgi:hypothetical protein